MFEWIVDSLPSLSQTANGLQMRLPVGLLQTVGGTVVGYFVTRRFVRYLSGKRASWKTASEQRNLAILEKEQKIANELLPGPWLELYNRLAGMYETTPSWSASRTMLLSFLEAYPTLPSITPEGYRKLLKSCEWGPEPMWVVDILQRRSLIKYSPVKSEYSPVQSEPESKLSYKILSITDKEVIIQLLSFDHKRGQKTLFKFGNVEIYSLAYPQFSVTNDDVHSLCLTLFVQGGSNDDNNNDHTPIRIPTKYWPTVVAALNAYGAKQVACPQRSKLSYEILSNTAKEVIIRLAWFAHKRNQGKLFEYGNVEISSVSHPQFVQQCNDRKLSLFVQGIQHHKDSIPIEIPAQHWPAVVAALYYYGATEIKG